mgnify:CR=1 FL=1
MKAILAANLSVGDRIAIAEEIENDNRILVSTGPGPGITRWALDKYGLVLVMEDNG